MGKEEDRSSSEDEGLVEVVEPIAKFRSRRANAGSNIAALIEEQRDKLVTQGTDDDADIYASAYGGFHEEEDEKDIDPATLSDDSDSISSELLDSDEDSEDKDSEAETADEPKRKKRKKFRGVITKAYKEPQRNIAVTVVKNIPKSKPLAPPLIAPSGLRLRQSTLQNTLLLKKRLEADKGKKTKERHGTTADVTTDSEASSRRRAPQRPLTQEERLRIARKTEEENIASLKQYTLAEIEARKRRQVQMRRRKTIKGVFVKSRSYLVDSVDDSNAPVQKSITSVECHDADTFESLFPLRRTAEDIRRARELAEKRQNLACAITGKPAKYIDPVTQLPYSSVAAFKEIRTAYEQWLMRSFGHLLTDEDVNMRGDEKHVPPALRLDNAVSLDTLDDDALIIDHKELVDWLRWKRQSLA